jgi:hypothetical protein
VRTRVAALWLAGALISGFTARRYIGPLDEGILLQAATRMGAGQWPWRDFGWAYGPGGPLVAMAAAKLLGPSLLWWRALRVAADATAAVLVWALVREARPRWALAAWAAAACLAAQPTSANPTAAALAFALAAVYLATRCRVDTARRYQPDKQAVWAGVTAGLAAFWRPDMGAIAALAAAATLALRPAGEERASPADGEAATASAGAAGEERAASARAGAARESAAAGGAGQGALGGAGRPAGADRFTRSPRTTRVRPALACLLAAAVTAAVLYAPFLVAAGPARVWNALVVQASRDGAWWRLPFPNAYPGRLSAHPSDLKDLAGWLAPYVALAIVVLSLRRRTAGPAILALGAVVYFLSRADEEHAQPLLVLACALAPLAARPRALAAAGLALLLALGVANRASALLRPPDLATLHVPGAGGVRVPPVDARALPRVKALVQHLVPPGEPIYVAPRRSDLVSFSDPLLHFLVGRPNVLHRDVLLQAEPREQRRIVAALERARPKVVIRWTDPASSQPEPNRRGRPSGSRALDEYLQSAYRLRARFGYYDVLVPR